MSLEDPEKGLEDVKLLENLSCEGTLGELGLFTLEKRGLRRALVMVFQYVKGSHEEDGGTLFTRRHAERMRSSGCKLR